MGEKPILAIERVTFGTTAIDSILSWIALNEKGIFE